MGFGLGGKEVEADSPSCVAKWTEDPDTRVRRYWVWHCTAGILNGQMFNPNDPMYMSNPFRITDGGRRLYEFRAVKQEAFDAYLRFLRTNNQVHLRHAERCV